VAVLMLFCHNHADKQSDKQRRPGAAVTMVQTMSKRDKTPSDFRFTIQLACCAGVLPAAATQQRKSLACACYMNHAPCSLHLSHDFSSIAGIQTYS
jgi:hypothetical protein